MGEDYTIPNVTNRSMPDSEILSRFGYHKGTETTMPIHRSVRSHFIQLATTLDDILPSGRAKSLAFTALEEAEMWANKAVAEMAPVVDE